MTDVARIAAFYDTNLDTGETVLRSYHLDDEDAAMVERVAARVGRVLPESMTPNIYAEKIDVVTLGDADAG